MAVNFVCGFIVSIMVVRGLSQEHYGGYKLISTILSVGPLLYGFGLESALARFGTEILARGQRNKLLRFVFQILGIRGGAILLIIALSVFVWTDFAAFFNFPDVLAEHPVPVIMIVILTATNLLWGTALHAVRMAQYQDRLTDISLAIFRLIAFGFAVWMGWGLTGIIFSWSATLAFGTVQHTVRNVRWISRMRRMRDDAGVESTEQVLFRRRVVRFAALSAITGSIYVMKDIAVDNLVIAKMLGPESVALYGLVTTIVLMVIQVNPVGIMRSVTNTWIVHRYHENSDPAMLLKIFRTLNKATLVVSLPLYVSLIVLGDKVIGIVFRPDYLAAYPTLVVLCSTMFFVDLARAFQPLIFVLEKKELELAIFVLAVYNLVLDIVLVPQFGIIGAAIATGSANVLQLLFLYGAFWIYVGLPVRFPFSALARVTIILMPVVGVTIVVRPFVTSIPLLITVFVVSGIYYVFMVVKLGPFDDDERQTCRQALGYLLDKAKT